ncbi:hypothetical protein PHMEG_00010896 [Phytophthora megakarya]|uniref:Uncharacterized protein n=1 Tax=Phytophthora megakarya TaxID=4795 RepID=A0A225WCV3_9STRA|nr:hypothetical protein PHMEG_00010896 [Phytophthora megakarya]
MVPDVVPTSFPRSAVHQQSDHTFFVGIPAWSQHLAEDKYTRDGYGGIEVVQCVDGLTAVDLRDLAALVDQDGDVDELTLRSRADRPLDVADLKSLIDSTMVRRELASVLAHYSPDRLAQKVFASTTFIKRLLSTFRQLHSQVDTAGRTAVQNMLDAQSETTRVRAGYATPHEFYWNDLRGVLAEHELQTRALHEGVAELRSPVENLRLLGRNRYGARRLDVPLLMNFLNRGQTRVNDNWKRLQRLLEKFRDNGIPEGTWSTLISVTAVDDPFAQNIPFATLPEGDSDSEEKDPGGDRGGNDQGGDRNNEVDLTQHDSGASEPPSRKTSPVKKGKGRVSSRKVPDSPQIRPSGWVPTQDEARSPSNKLMFSEAQVRETMKTSPSFGTTSVLM